MNVMKKIITLTVLFAVLSITAFSSNYEEIMKTNIDKIYKSSNPEELTALANQFQRIANVETAKWIPIYYAAYCFTRATVVSNMDKDEVHKHLDLAQAEIDKLLKVAAKESEVFTLQALVYQLRITDAAKGYKYSSLSNEALTVAEKLNAKNPRIYYLKGSNTFHTPKMFGGGKEKAKPFLQKAAEMFASEKPESKLSPSWGSVHCAQLLEQCNSEK